MEDEEEQIGLQPSIMSLFWLPADGWCVGVGMGSRQGHGFPMWLFGRRLPGPNAAMMWSPSALAVDVEKN